MKVRWLDGVAGNSNVYFAEGGTSTASIEGDTLTVKGPPLATLTVTPSGITETDGATEIPATCSLSRPAIEETTCALAVQSGSTAMLSSDYTASPAIDDVRIVIPKDATSSTSAFTLTPVPAGDGGNINIGLGSVTAAGKAVAWDMQPASIEITDVQPGLVLDPPALAPLAEGGTTEFKLHLRAPAASGEVVVNVASSNESDVTAAPASLTFTSVNWKDAQTVTVTGVDEKFDDGDKAYTLTLAVNNANTPDANYHDVRESISGTITDTDSTTIALSAVPAVLSESAGAQDVVITASLSGGILVEADTRITLGTQSGTAMADAD
ncbi:MAG: hypothetical protein OD918_08450, partial [Gammaproteobacteria bacterium]